MAACGRSRRNFSKSVRPSRSVCVSWVARTEAVRVPLSSIESSPKKSPRVATSSTMRSPVSFLKNTSTSPELMTYIESPGSP